MVSRILNIAILVSLLMVGLPGPGEAVGDPPEVKGKFDLQTRLARLDRRIKHFQALVAQSNKQNTSTWSQERLKAGLALRNHWQRKVLALQLIREFELAVAKGKAGPDAKAKLKQNLAKLSEIK